MAKNIPSFHCDFEDCTGSDLVEKVQGEPGIVVSFGEKPKELPPYQGNDDYLALFMSPVSQANSQVYAGE